MASVPFIIVCASVVPGNPLPGDEAEGRPDLLRRHGLVPGRGFRQLGGVNHIGLAAEGEAVSPGGPDLPARAGEGGDPQNGGVPGGFPGLVEAMVIEGDAGVASRAAGFKF